MMAEQPKLLEITATDIQTDGTITLDGHDSFNCSYPDMYNEVTATATVIKNGCDLYNQLAQQV